MKITKIRPQGYCLGVVEAIQLVKKSLDDPNTKKPIYILGKIIHNQKVVDEFTKLGVKTIDDKSKSRLELLDQINEGTVIFSAHGVSKEVYNKAKEKDLNIIDASCKFVLKVHKEIENMITKGYDVIYIGVKNHPESEGVLGISNNIHLITTKDDINNLKISNNKIYITTQTTLGSVELASFFEKIKVKYPNALIQNGICDATTKRQLAIINQKDADLCIIVGDPSSSNTNKLYLLSKEYTNIKTIMIENLEQLKMVDLKNILSVNISSGASTPSILVDEVINYLEKL